MSLKSFQFVQGGGGGGSGTVTLVSTDANLTGGPISTTGTIGLANVVNFGQGNVALTNANVGTAIVNMNMLNSIVNNLNAQIPVQYATTTALTATYANGTLGVGATLTNSGAQAALAIDGYTFTATDVTNGTRVLVKNQGTAAYNGAYVVTNQGSGSTNWVLTRATDYDQSAEMNAGDGFYVISGSSNGNTTWVQQTTAPITVGSTSLVFTQFAKVATGTVTNVATGAGLTGGPITSTGTISLATSGVTANTYGSATVIPVITVDTYGRITSATNTAGTFGTVSTVATSGNIAGGPITSTGTLSLTSNVVTINETQTLTNKRITPRVANVTTTSTITPPGDTVDQYEVLALASGATVAAPSGTPTDGQKLILRIKDNGTAQTLSWTTSAGAYRPIAVVLPSLTVISSVFYAGCIYNQQDNYWDVVTTVQQ